MYEKEATMLVKALEPRVAGHASASKGPGPSVTVRYRVDAAAVELCISFAAGKISVQASAQPEGAIVWGVRERPISAAGIAQAVSEITEWLRQRGSGANGIDAAPIETTKS
jgi:hypothetical protein